MRFIHVSIVFALSFGILPVLAQGRFDRPTFFRDGQQQMEREIQRMQQIQQQQPPKQALEHPSQLLTVDEGKLRWQKYLFRDGGFSIWMPQGIQSQEMIDLETAVGKISFEVFSTQPINYRFVAAYSDSIPTDVFQQKDDLLSAVRDGIVAKTDLAILGDRPLSEGSYPGREIKMQDDREVLSFHLYAINQRVYVLAVGDKQSQIPSEIAQNYFSSFRLLN